MTDCALNDEIKDGVLLLQLVDIDGAHGIDEWSDWTPLEFGILSWHLHNFYSCPLW